MDKQEIMTALAAKYRKSYDKYQFLAELAKQQIQAGNNRGYEILNRQAERKSDFLEGMAMAAQTLGIEWDEFIERVQMVDPSQTSNEKE